MSLDSFYSMFSTKTYITGLDEKGEITTQNLNRFHLILRNIFGLYRETHLQNVTRKIVDQMKEKNFIFAKDVSFKVMQLLNISCKSNDENNSIDTSEKFRLGKIFNPQLTWEYTCSLRSASSYMLRMSPKEKFQGSLVFVFAVQKDSQSLKVDDYLRSDLLVKSQIVLMGHELFDILGHILKCSPKIESIHWDNIPEELIDVAILKKCVVEQNVSGTYRTIIKSSDFLSSKIQDLPPLSLDLLMQFSNSSKSDQALTI